MNLRGLLPIFLADPAIEEACQQAQAPALLPQLAMLAAPGMRPGIIALLAERRPLTIVTATGREAEALAANLGCYLDPAEIAVLPAWETLPHERLSPRSDTVGRRLAVFRRLAHPDEDHERGAGEIRVLIVPVRALLQPVVAGLGELEPVSAQVGEFHDPQVMAEQLSARAYQRVDLVTARGEFAVRGGVIDVFPPTRDHPVRLEFFGDEVEDIREFSADDQRTIGPAEDGLWAVACRELIIDQAVRARAAQLADALPGARDMLEQIAQGIVVEGMEALAPVLVDKMELVFDLLAERSLMIVDDPERVRRRAEDLIATTEEFMAAAWSSAAAGGAVPIDLRAASFRELSEARAAVIARGGGWWTLASFGLDAGADPSADSPDGEDAPSVDILRIDWREPRRYARDVDAALEDLRTYISDGWRVVLVAEGPGIAQRLANRLGEMDVPARYVQTMADEPTSGTVNVVAAPPTSGFIAPLWELAVVTSSDITGRRGEPSTRSMRTLPARRSRKTVDPLSLHAGDYVVHETHGIGRFIELSTREIGKGENKAIREYMVLEYAPSRRGQAGDRLWVPTDSLDKISRYTGGETPTLSKMGGSDWARTKSKARAATKEIAAELVRLYAARTAVKGYAFGPDTPWQRELEDAFAYRETPDQLVTIDEVKADMEKPYPMDRLISGDVGYGKTEIAVRAAFKAVQDGKQVAVLVPTTLLVSQHYETFTERYAGFPVNVAALSRFQDKRTSEQIIAGLKSGTIDVVIGTHRLLTGGIEFKDLGLVIIDEEQRFGVEHKETLKAMRTDVDVLAMSATPIPRTLEMAVTGIREMSTLATPPEERHPVLTFVGRYEDKQVAAAIRRELLREGQVFYVHNRVRDISKVAAHIQTLVPEARVAIAHGQMSERQLEEIINGFWAREYDVLVCSTIVETGLDISNANTLIVDNADKFGLSQLHQLRGRVGRARERAYAYFLYSPRGSLTETAIERLSTIASHTELGSGIAVAMKDLEIRGAGNLLGGEQSGHIAGVGFDLYVRMVAEAVERYKRQVGAADTSDDDAAPKDVRIDLPLDAHVPQSYIAHDRLRLEVYQKAASARTDEDIAALREELTDRYGPIPAEIEMLFAVAKLRQQAIDAGLSEISGMGQRLKFAPVELPASGQVRLKRLYPQVMYKPALRQLLLPWPKTKKLGGQPLGGAALLVKVKEMVAAIADQVDEQSDDDA